MHGGNKICMLQGGIRRVSDKTDRQYYEYYEWIDEYYEWADEYYEWTDEYYE